MTTYKCPHCGKEIGEVKVIEMNKKTAIAAGMGIGCGLLVYPLMPTFWGAIGAFIIAFLIVFLTYSPAKKSKP